MKVCCEADAIHFLENDLRESSERHRVTWEPTERKTEGLAEKGWQRAAPKDNKWNKTGKLR